MNAISTSARLPAVGGAAAPDAAPPAQAPPQHTGKRSTKIGSELLSTLGKRSAPEDLNVALASRGPAPKRAAVASQDASKPASLALEGIEGYSKFGTHFKSQGQEPGATTQGTEVRVGKESRRGNEHAGAQGQAQAQAGALAARRARVEGLGAVAGGSAEASAAVQAEGSASAKVKGAKFNAQGQAVATADVRGSGEVQANLMEGVKLDAGAEGRVMAAAQGSAVAELGPAKAKVSGMAAVGAEAGAGVTMGLQRPHLSPGADGEERIQGLKASAGAFAGAQANAKAQADLPGVKVDATATAYAGIGAKAKVTAAVQRTENARVTVQIGAEAGVALGVGAALGAHAQLDVTPLAMASEAVGHAVQRGLSHAGERMSEGVAHAHDGAAARLQAGKEKVDGAFENAQVKVRYAAEAAHESLSNAVRRHATPAA
jgi:hypothetical protein